MKQRQIVIIGVGGAGARIVGRVAVATSSATVTLAVDSDTCALAASEAASRVQVGEITLGGFGSGGDEKHALEAMEESASAVLDAVGEVEIAVVIVGLGGGLGTGGTPFLIKTLRDAGIFTFCFATLPFTFEGRPKQAVAERGLVTLCQVADAVVCVANDRLCENADEESLAETFRRADGLLGGAVHALWQMLVHPGYINVGSEDLKRIAFDSDGACTFAFADAGGEDRAHRAVESLLASPLSGGGRLVEQARLLMLSIVGGPDLTLKDVGAIMARVSEKARAECRVVMGTALDDAWVGRVSLSLIIGERRAVRTAVEVPVTPVPPQASGEQPPPASRLTARPRGRGSRQGRLPLDVSGRGRFKDVEPTILNGEDLDVPTFIRRGIKIEK